MALIRQGRIVPDPWIAVADGDALPDDGRPAIVPLSRFQAERAALMRRAGALGIRLAPDQPPALIADDLRRFDLVALDFPKFTDGRAYSQARLLRSRWNFAGEIRATGQVLRDQLAFMRRCGFDAFEIADKDAPAAWRRATGEIGVCYQSAADERVPASRLREARIADPTATGIEASGYAGAWAY
jgi:uncharacterized protein (DUF934 family)